MRYRNTLGPSGGTRGVQHVGKVIGLRRAIRRGRRLRPLAPVARRPARVTALVRFDAGSRVGVDDHHRGRAVLQDHPDPFVGIGEVDGDVDGTRREHGKGGSDDVGGSRDGDGHPVAGAYAVTVRPLAMVAYPLLKLGEGPGRPRNTRSRPPPQSVTARRRGRARNASRMVAHGRSSAVGGDAAASTAAWSAGFWIRRRSRVTLRSPWQTAAQPG